MRRRLFAVGPTEVWLHPAALLFALYMVLAGSGRLLVCGTLSILLHEGGHALVSTLLSHPPAALELTPLGCLMRLEDEETLPPLPRLAVLLAGPAVTALLCWLSVLMAAWGSLPRDTARLAFACNAAILCVNALPALPLDGGRLLALLLGLFLPPQRVRGVLRGLGTALGALLVGLNCAVCLRCGGWNLSLGCAGCFLIYAAARGTERAALSELQAFMARRTRLETRGHLRTCLVTVTDALPLHRAVGLLHPTRRTLYQVVTLGTARPGPLVGEERLIDAYLKKPGETCRIFVQGAD